MEKHRMAQPKISAPKIKLPDLELETREHPDGGWCVVSADPTRPLTKSEAQKLIAAHTVYLAAKELRLL